MKKLIYRPFIAYHKRACARLLRKANLMFYDDQGRLRPRKSFGALRSAAGEHAAQAYTLQCKAGYFDNPPSPNDNQDET